MLCPNCDTKNRDGAKFCDECGTLLTAVETDDADERREAEASSTAEEASDAVVDGSVEAAAAAGDGAATVSVELDSAGAAQAASATKAIDLNDEGASATQVIDLGLDGIDREVGDYYNERVISPDYNMPGAGWRDGHTMQMPRVESDDEPMNKDYLASNATKQQKSKKTVVGIIAAIVVVVAVALLATYQMQLWGGKAVPDVRGLTEADATNILEDNGFTVKSLQVKSDETEGLVLLTDPSEGSRVPEGAQIVIHIAKARSIPDVIGKTEDEARAALAEEGYENVTFNKKRSDEAEGTVLSISPETGSRAKSSVEVAVEVAEPYVVPDTASMGYDEAVAAIQNEGLRYDVSYVDTEEYPDGSLIQTDPAAGAKVKSDTIVVLYIARARGAELIALTQGLLAPGSSVDISGVSYSIDSLDSTEYAGKDTVKFTFTGHPYGYLFGQYVQGSTETVSGQVVWTADNQVSSIS